MQETQVTSKRITLVDKDNYRVDLEYNDDYAILHLPRATGFSKGVLADMKMQFNDILTFALDMGYDRIICAIQQGDVLTTRLLDKFKFEYQGSADGYEVYDKKELI